MPLDASAYNLISRALQPGPLNKPGCSICKMCGSGSNYNMHWLYPPMGEVNFMGDPNHNPIWRPHSHRATAEAPRWVGIY